ncbi:hypothetical protein [Caballeronia calidae]|uniref:hypothetical protein n=1 Tax=Caballeronia calidae TaxID=1777139 RepID=UPI000787B785|nr:hypothetical protein [Caballeronia calidae]
MDTSPVIVAIERTPFDIAMQRLRMCRDERNACLRDLVGREKPPWCNHARALRAGATLHDAVSRDDAAHSSRIE